jgi:hypothetical protein
MSIATETAVHPYRILSQNIGTSSGIEGWPSRDLDGLIQALGQWTLAAHAAMHGEDPTHPHVAFEAPYRGLAWCACVQEPIPGDIYRKRYVGTKPIYPDHPNAVRYCGNFEGYSFGFELDTDDPALMKVLDDLIAANMKTPDYQEALRAHRRKR